jgi:DnaJ homolog subfamily C member 2
MAAAHVTLPALPEGWTAEKDYKVLSALSKAIQRNVEPVGPHFLAHARRVCFFTPINLCPFLKRF